MKYLPKLNFPQFQLGGLVLGGVGIVLFQAPLGAQITSDFTTNTTVNQNGNDFTIEQGDRVGNNLFQQM